MHSPIPRRLPNPPYIIKDMGYITPCWLWLGCKRKGYGMMHNPNYRGNGPKMLQAHRVYYEQAKGKIPIGFLPDHLCRVRHCVNFDHIELVTNVENIRRGSAAIIDLQKAQQIRELHAQGMFQEEIAVQFGISQPTVSQIIRKVTWK